MGRSVLGKAVCDTERWQRNYEHLIRWGLRDGGVVVPRSHRLLHGRNVAQVLGHGERNVPSRFLVCWAEVNGAGKVCGGTATAVALAERWGVRVFNLVIPADRERVENYLK